MSFYLPLMINNRRLHVCHLQQHDETEPLKTIWGFIISKTGSQMLLSVKALDPKLISMSGEHIELNGKHTFAFCKGEITNGIPSYKAVLTTSANAVKLHQPECGFMVEGKFGLNDDESCLKVIYDSTILRDKEFDLVIEYQFKGKVYTDAIRCYMCPSFEEMGVSAALDFGSEASQVRMSSSANSAPIISSLENLMGLPKADPNREFWQGKPSETLFKSIFWIDHKPKSARHAELPEPYQQRPLVAPLMPSNASPQAYEDLELLPNLKIVELASKGEVIKFDHEDIILPPGSDVRFKNAPNLADDMMRSSVLRVILSNFLHVILRSICAYGQEKYLRLILMVPNVYFQNKVFDMIKGVYEDFSIMKSNGLYASCKGIEIMPVSESDAAFIGAKSLMGDAIENASGKYFLNIDSGKGTTDFSIMRQQIEHNKYVSVYRDGIPAAGNVLTYAYYQAFHDFMLANGIDIYPWIANAQKSHLINFMSYIERFKINQAVEASYAYLPQPQARNVRDLSSLLTYMSSNLDRKIPCAAGYVEVVMASLIESLERSLKNFTSMKNTTFHQVVLSGRALLYKPFHEKLVQMLIANNWINSPGQVVWIEGNLAKTCCLEGALNLETDCDVNYNSGLIGSPLVERAKDAGDKFDFRFLKKFFGNSGMTNIDMEFFYKGSTPISATNVILKLGCRRHTISGSGGEDKVVFFVGDGFITQVGNARPQRLNPREIPFNDPNLPELVQKSLFPYFPGSIVQPAGKFFNPAREKEMKSKTAPATATVVTNKPDITGTGNDDVDA